MNNTIEKDAIAFELRRIFKLILMLGSSEKTQKEQILMLDTLGLSFAEIGEILGIKPDAARMTITRSKK